MLKPRIPMLEPRIPMLKTVIRAPRSRSKTLKQRQQETGRTLALNGEAWRRLRAAVLAEQPLCVICAAQGRTAAATDVDHRDNDPTNNDRDNLQGLCHECHSRKTQADMGKAVNWGCDASGHPIDPHHPWQKSLAAERPEPPPQSRLCANCAEDPQRVQP